MTKKRLIKGIPDGITFVVAAVVVGLFAVMFAKSMGIGG